jgi:hypothetical protein
MNGCFCGMYQRVGVHAYGCPATETSADDKLSALYAALERMEEIGNQAEAYDIREQITALARDRLSALPGSEK